MGVVTGKYIPDLSNLNDPTLWPDDIESLDAMKMRAKEFLVWIRKTYPGQRVLAVGHGIINKAIQSVFFDKPMKEITVTVVDPVGLHARPATVAVNAASKFKSEVKVSYKGRTVNMKSLWVLCHLVFQHSPKLQFPVKVMTKTQLLRQLKMFFALKKLLLNR